MQLIWTKSVIRKGDLQNHSIIDKFGGSDVLCLLHNNGLIECYRSAYPDADSSFLDVHENNNRRDT